MKGCQINAIIIILKWSTTDGRELKISEYTSQRKNAQYFLRLFQLYIDMLILSWDLYFSLWMVGRKVWKPLPKATLFTHKISNYCSFIVHSYNVEILKQMGIPDHPTCLLRNLYAGQEATARNGHGTMGWFQIGKGVCLGCILSPCIFNLHAEYIMQNAGLDEAQAGIKS